MALYNFSGTQDKELIDQGGSLLRISGGFRRTQQALGGAEDNLITAVANPYLEEASKDPEQFKKDILRREQDRAVLKQEAEAQWKNPLIGVPIDILTSLDPTMLIPIVGEAKLAALAGKYGKIGARAIAGVTEGAVGNLIAEPFLLANAAKYGTNYGLQDSLINTVLGGVAGGGLHVGLGAAGDAIQWGRTSAAGNRAALSVAAQQLSEGKIPDVRSILEADYHSQGRVEARAAIKEEKFGPSQPRDVTDFLTSKQTDSLTPEERTLLENKLANDPLFSDHSDLDTSTRLELEKAQRQAIETTLGKNIVGDMKVTDATLAERTRDSSADFTKTKADLDATRQDLDALDKNNFKSKKAFTAETNKLTNKIEELNNKLADSQGKIDEARAKLSEPVQPSGKPVAELSKSEFVREFLDTQKKIKEDPALNGLSNTDLDKLSPEQKALLDRSKEFYQTEKLDPSEVQRLNNGDINYIKALHEDIQYKKQYGQKSEMAAREAVVRDVINPDKQSSKLAGQESAAEFRSSPVESKDIETDITAETEKLNAIYKDNENLKALLEENDASIKDVDDYNAAEEVAMRCRL